MIAHVLLPIPIEHGFDFLVPPELEDEIEVGQRVRVRFTGTARTGVVVRLGPESDHPGPLEEVIAVLPPPAYSTRALAFVLETAQEYIAPPGIVVNRILPSRAAAATPTPRYSIDLAAAIAALDELEARAPRQAEVIRALLTAAGPVTKKELAARVGRGISRPLSRLLERGLVREFVPTDGPATPAPPPPDWASVVPESGSALLFGGLQAADYPGLIGKHETALLLAPEILAAKELHRLLLPHFPRAELYHSGLSEGDRGRIWEQVRAGTAKIVVGTRSAVFLPFPDLDLVLVDREEDRGYKQSDMLPYYHARALARRRGKTVLLASPAPAVETYHQAMAGEIALVRPPQPSREVERVCVDMRKEPGVVTRPLAEGIAQVLDAGRKGIVVVPRRGYFQAVACKNCGEILRCPSCGTPLVYAARRAQLVCRVCGRAYPSFTCPSCGGRALRFLGTGLERVKAELHALFPSARVALIDAEAVRRRPGIDLTDVLSREAELVVGTPIIAKGTALPEIGIAAAVGIDAILAASDFRAGERTYQLLANLSTRLTAGRLIVQTRYPDHYAITAALAGDYVRFYSQELESRRAFSYPPFSHLARIILPPRQGAALESALREFPVEFLGPSSPPGRGGKELFLIKAPNPLSLQEACRAAKQAIPKAEIDIDPERI